VDADAAIQLIQQVCRAAPPDRRRSAKSFHDAVDFALVQQVGGGASPYASRQLDGLGVGTPRRVAPVEERERKKA
jgi:hypothetical protein